MKVKALEAGFFSANRRRKGEVFDVPEGAKASWFVPVAVVKAPEAPAPAAKGKAEAKKAGADLA